MRIVEEITHKQLLVALIALGIPEDDVRRNVAEVHIHPDKVTVYRYSRNGTGSIQLGPDGGVLTEYHSIRVIG